MILGKRINKKGMSFEIAFSIMWLIFLTFVLLAIVALVNMLILSTSNTKEIQAEAFVYHILYSPQGISYTNEVIQRTYPGKIDEKKFSQEFMDSTVKANDNKMLSARITIRKADDKSPVVIIYNKEWFDKWFPLAETNLPGPGGATSITKTLPVIIKNNEKETQGMLTIDVVMPNS